MVYEVVYRESPLKKNEIVFVHPKKLWRSIDLIPSLIYLIIFSLQVKKNRKSKVGLKAEKNGFWVFSNTDFEGVVSSLRQLTTYLRQDLGRQNRPNFFQTIFLRKCENSSWRCFWTEVILMRNIYLVQTRRRPGP
mgnify:CR=1 FL=1